MNTPIIACCCDENFRIHLNVMLKSLDSNLKSSRKAEIFILYSGISDNDKNNINKTLSNLKINWICVREEIFQNYKIDKHISAAAYYRLLIPKLIPSSIKKIIYLDLDIVVLRDIGELWDEDISNNYIGAVNEVLESAMYVSSPAGLPVYKKLGLDSDIKIFNTGVMVINLEIWRNEKICEKAMMFLNKYKNEILWWDQDALNAIIAGRIYELNPQWNQLTQIFMYKSWKHSPYNERVYRDVTENPYIIHFNTKDKPWHKNNNHKYKKHYLKYLEMIKPSMN